MTLGSFRVRFPEFSKIGDTYVTACLTDAALRVSADAFGDNWDAAHGLLAAHLLWSSPHGATMRLDGEGTETASRYFKELAELRQEVVPSFLVT